MYEHLSSTYVHVVHDADYSGTFMECCRGPGFKGDARVRQGERRLMLAPSQGPDERLVFAIL